MRRIALLVASTVTLLAALLVIAPHLGRERGPNSRQAAGLTAPTLRELAGGLTIDCGYDGAVSAPEVCRDGHVVGLYIDDSTPDIRFWIAKAVAAFPHGVVLVAVAPNQVGLRYGPRPPVVNVLETYWWGGFTASELLPLPKYAGYIVQDRYVGPAGRRPPPAWQRLAWLARVRAKQPRFIFLY